MNKLLLSSHSLYDADYFFAVFFAGFFAVLSEHFDVFAEVPHFFPAISITPPHELQKEPNNITKLTNPAVQSFLPLHVHNSS